MKRVAEFLRVIDIHDGNVSLTNVALLIVLVKLAVAPEVTLVDAGALLVALLSYQGKKLIRKDVNKDSEAATQVAAMQERVDELASKVQQQQIALRINTLNPR